MEKCLDEGLVKSIGLSNCNSVQVQDIIDNCRIKPVVLQVRIATVKQIYNHKKIIIVVNMYYIVINVLVTILNQRFYLFRHLNAYTKYVICQVPTIAILTITICRMHKLLHQCMLLISFVMIHSHSATDSRRPSLSSLFP